jgi:hypothetical protein
MLPLPIPQAADGGLEALATFVNVPSHDDLVLVATWLLAALRPGGPYPVLAIAGEQGSAEDRARPWEAGGGEGTPA